MRRVLCVRLPHWPLQRLLADRPAWRRRPVAVYEAAAAGPLALRQGRLVACSRLALRLGLRPGQSVAEALALADAAGEAADAPPKKVPDSTGNPKKVPGTLASPEKVPETRGQPAAGPAARNAPRGPGLHLELHQPEVDRQRLLELAAWCQQFSPRVSLDETAWPDSLLLEITGCQRIYRSELRLARQVQAAFREQGWTTRLALAETAAGAWALAHFQPLTTEQTAPPKSIRIVAPGQLAAALAPLPVEALQVPEVTRQRLHELGLRTIGQVESLARTSLPARFGPQLLWQLDLAFGRAVECLQAERPPEPVEAWREFEYGIAQTPLLLDTLRQMIEEVLAKLRPHRLGLTHLQLTLRLDAAPPQRLGLRLIRPTLSVRHVEELIGLQLQRRQFTQPIIGCRAEVTGVQPLEERQADLFNHRQVAEAAAWDRLVDRLSSRLGRGRVLRAQLQAEAQPEYAYRWESAQEEEPRPQGQKATAQRSAGQKVGTVAKQSPSAEERPPATAAHRPLRLAGRPQPLAATYTTGIRLPAAFHQSGQQWATQRWWGPERIETGWWRGRPSQRDYYRVELDDGRQVWVFRQLSDGQWFLHGWFD